MYFVSLLRLVKLRREALSTVEFFVLLAKVGDGGLVVVVENPIRLPAAVEVCCGRARRLWFPTTNDVSDRRLLEIA